MPRAKKDAAPTRASLPFITMEKFQLSLLFKIIGLGSASGLVYTHDTLFIISDNSTYLYQYHIGSQQLDKIALVENPRDNIPKKEKPDFEAITLHGNSLYIMGSGSTANRNQLFKYNIKSRKSKTKDLSPIYARIKTEFGISDDQLNIEGVVMARDTIYLFQRGNGAHSKNGIIVSRSEDPPQFAFIPFSLPAIKGVESTFTDAVLVDHTLYFLATAEATTSTYHDGEVLGSLIGSIDLNTRQLGITQQISATQKFEGLTLYRKSKDQLEFLLCEDNDTDALASGIYRLTLDLK